MTVTFSGLRAWLVQRVTAVYLLCFMAFLLAHFIWNTPRAYEAWRVWVLGPWVSVAALLFFLALLLHAWVGLRDVILDYLHRLAARSIALVLLALGLGAVALWVLQIFFPVGKA